MSDNNGTGTTADRTIVGLLEDIRDAGGAGSGSGTHDDTKADKTVATKYRIKTDGTFQLWNSTSGLFHTLSLSGADGAVSIDIAAGEA